MEVPDPVVRQTSDTSRQGRDAMRLDRVAGGTIPVHTGIMPYDKLLTFPRKSSKIEITNST